MKRFFPPGKTLTEPPDYYRETIKTIVLGIKIGPKALEKLLRQPITKAIFLTRNGEKGDLVFQINIRISEKFKIEFAKLRFVSRLYFKNLILLGPEDDKLG